MGNTKDPAIDLARPRAFVLMPFAPEFDAIFEMLIVGALEQAGFDALRADNIKSQNNIMRDIIDAIAHSELIIADLTGSNPNVYYELGLAHGLARPVVLLTQEISELPFDLKSYRVIAYGTHFLKMDQARKELVDLAEEVRKGNVKFGSPVSDFLGRDPKHQDSQPESNERRLGARCEIQNEETGDVGITEIGEGTAGDELGLLDHLVDVEESFGELTELMNEITKEVNVVGQEANSASRELAAARERNKPGTAKYQRKVVRDLGMTVQKFGEMIAKSNGEYRRIQLNAQRSLEGVLAGGNVSDEETRSSLHDFLQALTRAERGATSGRAGVASMAEAMRNLDNLESTFNRASARAANELDRLAENIDLTIALINRAREKGEGMLVAAGDEPSTSDNDESSTLGNGDSIERGNTDS